MRKYIIANWKMSMTYCQTSEVAEQFLRHYREHPEKKVVLCPNFVALRRVLKLCADTRVSVGVQDVFWEERGAYTGEISAADVSELGCRYVILGHSERRKYLSETNENVHKKTRVAIKNNLIPIICIGEDWNERKEGKKDYVIMNQLSSILKGFKFSITDRIIVAYEPVWAISSSGGGIHAEPEEVGYVAEVIRQTILDHYDPEIYKNCFQVIYGGSVTSDTVGKYTQVPNVSGVLVGSASLRPDEFLKIIDNA